MCNEHSEPPPSPSSKVALLGVGMRSILSFVVTLLGVVVFAVPSPHES